MSDGNTFPEAILCAAHDAFTFGSAAILVLPDGSVQYVTPHEWTGGGGRDPGARDVKAGGGKNGGQSWSIPHTNNFPFQTVDETELR